MGSFVSTAKFFQLPFKSQFRWDAFPLTASDEEIIQNLAAADLNRIQAVNVPTDEEIFILNEIFKINPSIAFRHYSLGFSEVDVSYLSKLTNVKSLGLEHHSPIKNIETLEELELDNLTLSCFSVKDYSFLRNVSSKLKGLWLDLEDKTYKMDIGDIIHMTELETLVIRNVKRGLDKLTEFKNLKELSLRSVPIKDYSFLKEMNVKKICLALQNITYFNTFGICESIEEVSLWMNKKLTDISFLLQFPNLKRIYITYQNNIETVPDLTGLTKLEDVYFFENAPELIKKHCNPNVNVHTFYNPSDVN